MGRMGTHLFQALLNSPLLQVDFSAPAPLLDREVGSLSDPPPRCSEAGQSQS